MSDTKHEHPDAAELRATAERAVAHRTGVVLSGRVVNGKVELDQATVTEIARKFPGANVSFVAVNAPFDPKSRPIVGVAE